MHSVIRGYVGSQNLADELKKQARNIEMEISSVPGFIAYYLLKTEDGAVAVTVCEDRRSCAESTLRAAAWLSRNRPDLRLDPPHLVEGEVAFQFARTHVMA
ncbi:MAG TPA: hypothetical protein VGK03_08325 [Geothrix sp.]|jgi:hypothetical protein